MIRVFYQSIVATAVLVVLVSGIYPLVVTGIGQLLFRDQARGSLITGTDGQVVGSKLIGQAFAKPEYFHGRPSAAGNGYDASNSSGSNLGPTNQKLADGLKANVDALLKDNPTLKKGEIPVDLVTASGSGLDPHISPEAAYVQVNRVAAARGRSPEEILGLVKARIQGPDWGLFGEPVINVLLLNLDLDRLYAKK